MANFYIYNSAPLTRRARLSRIGKHELAKLTSFDDLAYAAG
jgi:hypothetical protein